jgi:diguanylate cyclase (GGDEF)-like protein
VNEKSELLKAKSMAWVKKYKSFREDVLEFELETGKDISLYNFIVYTVYGLICFLWNRYILKCPVTAGYICLGAGIVSLTEFLICKYFLEKHKGYVAVFINVLTTIDIVVLLSIDMQWNDLRGGNIIWTLLVFSIIATSLVCIVPYQYAVIMAAVVIIDTMEAIVCFSSVMDILYSLIDSIILAISCMCINIVFSRHQYMEFMRKEELKFESSRDALTKLYNRRYIERYYGLHANTESMCAIIMLDLDNFKKANDIYGHEKGDDVLCQASDILCKYFRGSDCVARLGGDEFAVFLQGVSDVDVIVKRVHNLLGEFPIVIDENERVEVSVSIGIALKDIGENMEYSKLCNKADEAMYIAKRMGKGRAVICPERSMKEMIVVA